MKDRDKINAILLLVLIFILIIIGSTIEYNDLVKEQKKTETIQHECIHR
jgi:hypothetical protein